MVVLYEFGFEGKYQRIFALELIKIPHRLHEPEQNTEKLDLKSKQ